MKTKILISILILAFCLIPNVFASVGSISTPVLIRDNTGSSAEMYLSTIPSDLYFEYSDIIFTYTLFGNTYNTKRFYSSDDNGTTWDDATGSISGNDYNHKPFGANYLDFVYDEVTNIAHVVTAEVTPSSFPYYHRYASKQPTDLGILNLNSYSDGWSLFTSNQYQSSPAICLIENKPVMAWWKYSGTVSLVVYFSTVQQPTSLPQLVSYTYDYQSYFGSKFGIIHMQPINENEVILILETQTDFRLFGIICNKNTGFGSPFEITPDDHNGYNDGNGWFASSVSLFSEYTLNHSNYAESIQLAYVNTSNSINFATWNVSSSTLSEITQVYDDSGNYDALGLTIAKDKDTYFLGFTGNKTTYNYSDFFVSERNPITETWNTTKLYRIDEISQYSPDCVLMSRQTYNGVFHAQFIEDTIDAYGFYFSAEGEYLPTPPTPTTPLGFTVDNELIFIVLAVISFMFIMYMLIYAKGKVKM